jgi:predicted amidohydrolase YtcJ
MLEDDRPVIVRSSFGHSALLNTKGIKLASIARDTPTRPAARLPATPAARPPACWKTPRRTSR